MAGPEPEKTREVEVVDPGSAVRDALDGAVIAVPELEILRRQLSDPDPEAVMGTCEAIADLGPSAADALPDLLRVMREGNRAVWGSATRAIESLGEDAHSVIPELLADAVNGGYAGR